MGGRVVENAEFHRIIRLKNGSKYSSLMKALRYYTDTGVNFKALDNRIRARRATKNLKPKSKNKPHVKFGPKFFTKLLQFPSVALDVRESRSSLRKTCYGFRDTMTGERVYLRVEKGGIAEFRDGDCGYLMGVKYLIPNVVRLKKDDQWTRVLLLLNRLLKKKGIIVTRVMTDKYLKSMSRRLILSERLYKARSAMWDRRIYK